MAIKGKKRSKPRSAPRPPKRAPVAAPTPFLQRRWVQVTAAFLLGLFVVIGVVWITNNTRASNDSEERAADAATRLAAATAYQRAVQGAYGRLGVVEPGIVPTILADFDAELEALAKGGPAEPATLQQAERDANSARKELEGFAVGETVSGQGFDELEALAFTGSYERLVRALDLEAQAARLATTAAVVGGNEGRRLAELAVEVRDDARAELNEGWTRYLQALRAGGIAEAPTQGGIVPELPGGGG